MVEVGAHCEPAMNQPTESTPILSRPHLLRGFGFVRLRGAGEVVIDLEGRGQVFVRRGRTDGFQFSGRGTPRHVTATEAILSNAEGRLVVDGEDLKIECRDGPVTIAVNGHFVVELDGCGEVETPRGRTLRWGLSPRRIRVAGSALVDDAA